MGAAPPALARQASALMAVATAPSLVRLTTIQGPEPGAPDRLASKQRARGAVLGVRAGSSDRKGSSDTEPDGARAASAVSTPTSDGSAPWVVILGLLFVGTAALALLALRRPGMTPIAAPTRTRAKPAKAPRPEAGPPPEVAPPAPDRGWHDNFWQSFVIDDDPSADTNGPTAREQRGGDAGWGRDARRMAGVAVSGAASLLLGLALRARRRR